jgi:hypothetical protein
MQRRMAAPRGERLQRGVVELAGREPAQLAAFQRRDGDAVAKKNPVLPKRRYF